MNSPVTNDLELAGAMSASIGSAYREAVEFSSVLPSHALVRFRDVLEEVCISLAKHGGLELVKTSIAKYISQLWDSRVITSGLKSKLNKIRMLCNEGAHQVRIVEEGAIANPLQQRHEILVSNAVEVRGLLLSVFEEVYRRANGAEAELNYKQVTIESQEWKDVIYWVFRSIVPTDSGPSCPAIPVHRAHPFRSIVPSLRA